MPVMTRRTLESITTLSNDSGTYTLQLPKKGTISFLEIFLAWDNGATNGRQVFVWDAFDNIEIIANGTEQIFSMTVRELFYWNWIILGKFPNVYCSELGGDTNFATLIIPFGLPLHNSQHFLPLAEFSNPELRISYSPTISATSGFATGTGQVGVWAEMNEEGGLGAFAGYLRNRTIRSFTAAASGVERTRIIGDYPILGLYINVLENAVSPVSTITNLKLSLNDGAKVHLDVPSYRYASQIMHELGIDGKFDQIHLASNTDASYLVGAPLHYPSVTKREAAPTIGTDPIPHAFATALAANQITYGMFNDTEDGAATAQVAYTTDIQLNIHGDMNEIPQGFLIPFGFPHKLDMALMPSVYDEVHLDLTQGNAGGDVRISQLDIAQP